MIKNFSKLEVYLKKIIFACIDTFTSWICLQIIFIAKQKICLIFMLIYEAFGTIYFLIIFYFRSLLILIRFFLRLNLRNVIDHATNMWANVFRLQFFQFQITRCYFITQFIQFSPLQNIILYYYQISSEDRINQPEGNVDCSLQSSPIDLDAQQIYSSFHFSTAYSCKQVKPLYQIYYMTEDLLSKVEADPHFKKEVIKNQERYRSLKQVCQFSTTPNVPEGILRKIQDNRQIYFYFGYQQPTLKKDMCQVAIYLIKNFRPNIKKPYKFVFFNEKCADNYVLWNFRQTFSYLPLEQIAALQQFIVFKPYFYHKTMDWMTFGTIPKFIRSRTKFIYSFKELCDYLKFNTNILAQNVPQCLYEKQLNNLVQNNQKVQNLRMNLKGQERNSYDNNLMFQFHKSIQSMIMKPGYEINNLQDYEVGAEGVPNILKMLIFYFDSHPQGLQLEGIFRKSVSIDEENQTISQILSKNYDYLLQVNNPHIIANLIKRFFSTLKTPVFPFDRFTNLMNDQAVKDKLEHLKNVFDSLPSLNKRSLLFLFSFFKQKVLKHENQNKMNVQNISICLAPCFFRSEKASTADLIYASKAVMYCKMFMTQFDHIFGTPEEREILYRKSYIQNKQKFQQNLQIGLELAIDITSQNLKLEKKNSRFSHRFQNQGEFPINLQQQFVQPQKQINKQISYQNATIIQQKIQQQQNKFTQIPENLINAQQNLVKAPQISVQEVQNNQFKGQNQVNQIIKQDIEN